MTPLQRSFFPTSLSDPPWICAAGGGGKGAQEHYPLMKTPDILRLLRHEFPAIFSSSTPAFHYMWGTSGSIEDVVYLAHATGFSIITDWAWVKGRITTGQYRRGEHETLYLLKRGSIDRIGQWPTSVFTEPATEHSRKPEESYLCIETVTPGPYLEIFARRERPGWTSWGNEVPLRQQARHA